MSPLRLVVVCVLASFALVGLVACGESSTTTVTVEEGAGSQGSEEVVEESSPEGEPEVEHAIASCDLGGGNLDELIGSVQVDNAGDAAAAVTVSFKWQLGDGSFVTAPDKQVEVEAGEGELVFFSKKVSLGEATSFQDHPGYLEGTNCEAGVESGSGGEAAGEPSGESESEAGGGSAEDVEHAIASCDLGGGNLDELIGSVQVDNAGDAAAAVTVSFKWQLGDGSFVTAPDKQVEVEAGEGELVFFSKKVGLGEATSFQDHPGYLEGTNCEAGVAGG